MTDKKETIADKKTSILKSFETFMDDLLTSLAFEKVRDINEEQMISQEVFYVPPGIADLHGDVYEEVEIIEAAVQSFNKAVEEGRAQPCLFHSHKTNCYRYGKAWVIDKPMLYGKEVLPAGTPLIEIHWTNKAAWELRKQGVLRGGSLYAKAGVINV